MRFSILLVCAAVFTTALQAQNVWMKAVTGQYERYRLNLNETAQFMPESEYEYKLTPAQRPFGEWIEHTALLNYNFCASIQGSAPPEVSKTLMAMKGKAAISKALADSFTYCDAAIATLDDAKATQEVTVGNRKVVPATVLVNLVASLNEHYGNLVGYLRTKGIVPPTTARSAQQKKN